MHAPYPMYVLGRDDISQYMQNVVIPKSIQIAGFLEIPWVVMHPFKMQYKYGLEAEQAMNVQFFSSLIPELKKHNVRICVENLYESVGGRITEGTCADPDDAIFYVDMLNMMAGEERFGICLDTGHIQLVHRQPADYIRKVGSRLKLCICMKMMHMETFIRCLIHLAAVLHAVLTGRVLPRHLLRLDLMGL